MHLNLKELLNDLKKITRTFNFGNENDEFVYTGPHLRKYNIRNSGFFYEFYKSGIFNQGSQPDLHLSIIDARGFAVPHVTFKPDGEKGIAFHYGTSTPDSLYEKFWITNPYFGSYNEQEIKDALKNVFTEAMDHIWVYRKDNFNNLIKTPYKFNVKGTVGRAPDTHKQEYAKLQKRRRRPPLAPLSQNLKNRRLSHHFKVDPFSD